VTVMPVNPPVIGSAPALAGQIGFSISGSAGPDYILQTSTDLVDWQPLLTTNPAALPFTLTVPHGTEPQRFYRIKLGP
jgi:hypothetical protein